MARQLPKIAPSRWEICTNTWFHGLTRVFIQNGMPIGSAIFAQLTVECPITLQCTAAFAPKIVRSLWWIGSPISSYGHLNFVKYRHSAKFELWW